MQESETSQRCQRQLNNLNESRVNAACIFVTAARLCDVACLLLCMQQVVKRHAHQQPNYPDQSANSNHLCNGGMRTGLDS